MGKLYKLIPSEIVAAYLAIQGVIPAAQEKWGLIIISLLLLIITPFYLRIVQKVQNNWQIVFSCLSFIVWLYCLGGPFKYLGIHLAWFSSVILILWTTFVPQFFKFKQADGISPETGPTQNGGSKND
jgi:hypothetical protein